MDPAEINKIISFFNKTGFINQKLSGGTFHFRQQILIKYEKQLKSDNGSFDYKELA